MIGLELFEKSFDEISASFSKTMQSKHKISWFAEVKNRDPEIFTKTCEKLKYGDRFPNFAMFRAAYIEAKEKYDIEQPVQAGCAWCTDRMVVWEFGDKSFAGRCKFCWETDKDTVDPMAIERNPKLTLIKPLPKGGEVAPIEAQREMLKYIGEIFESDADESVRSRNIAKVERVEQVDQECPF